MRQGMDAHRPPHTHAADRMAPDGLHPARRSGSPPFDRSRTPETALARSLFEADS